ncbi:DUF881 domain-containing protein [Sporosarcina sp. BI001-red]|uniref:DUF881 domain-containing protein n=1 Tax=Sporosarcina sp. BI001-red TaxID=2282866 RepID=UPI000E224441|nr:DUF881 domain-containing protein [Sporosarcina sp. BI001-red]REB09678.1 DUF881 domain-containing protein [Sporosarcina sp. BI001-red]
MKRKWMFTFILLIVGFMVAVQYNTVQQPEERDTRDSWAIRNELAKERKLHSELLTEVRALDQTLGKYNASEGASAGKALADTVHGLYQQAGMIDKTGPGIVIDVVPSEESVAFGTPLHEVSPELLTRFVNDVNRFKGIDMEIDGKRVTALSAIRDINGETTVNGLPVSLPPFQIKILSGDMESSEKLYNFLQSSSILDDFYLDDFVLEIGQPQSEVTINGRIDKFENRFLKELPKGG